jgi:ATP-dependent DNA helicase PIF1
VDSVPDVEQAVNYPIEFLNSLNPSGMPPHELKLKLGCSIMLLRNLDPPRLCNGTRMIVCNLHNYLIEATIAAGEFAGQTVMIPRIPLLPSDCPFEFRRLQFPVALSFAMSINKSQGQTLFVAVLFLKNPCFSHGQLYVGCSRVGKPTSLFFCMESNRTRNVVYEDVLQASNVL